MTRLPIAAGRDQRLDKWLYLAYHRDVGEKDYVTFLGESNTDRYRHYHMWERGRIVTFRIQYEALIEGEWRPIVRYDTAHGYSHKDVMHPDGTQSKEKFPYYSNAEVLTYGQRDIRRKWRRYREAYEQEMKR